MTSTTSAPLSLAKPWQQAWPDSAERNAVYGGLCDLGLETVDARAWMQSLFGQRIDNANDLLFAVGPWVSSELPTDVAVAWADALMFTPSEARQWYACGFNPTSARPWYASGITPPLARRWYVRGFTPSQAVLVGAVISRATPNRSAKTAIAERDAWLGTGLLARLVVLGVATGETPVSMLDRVANGLSREDEGMMAFCAALRGVDVQALTVNLGVLDRVVMR